MFSRKMKFAATALSAVLAAQNVYAASGNPLTAPAPTNLLAPPAPAPELKRETPKVEDKLSLPSAESPKLNFAIQQVRIVGSTVFEEAALAREFDGLLNRQVSVEELQNAISRVNALYAEAGYALGRAYIPQQLSNNGVLTVRVVEGYIGNILIYAEDNDKNLEKSIRRFGEKIVEERPLRTETLQRYLLLLSDQPGAKISAELVGMDVSTGAATLRLNASQKYFEISNAISNRAKLDGLPFQPYTTASINNVLGWGEQLQVTALLSPKPRQQHFFNVSMSNYIGSEGWQLRTSAAIARSEADDLPPTLSLVGDTFKADAVLRYPWIRSTKENLYSDFGGYILQNHNDLNNIRFTEDKLRVLFAGMEYSKLIGTDLGVSAFGQASKGLDIWDAGPKGSLHSRVGATASFFKLRGGLSANYRLSEQWMISASAEGQLSSASLFSSEEISFGGAKFGRGFDQSETSGDSGYGTSLQLQRNFTTNAAGGLTISPYAFLDHSKVYNRAGDLQGNKRLVSTGAGVTVSNQKWLSVGVEVDKPLNRDVFSRGNRAPRLYLSLQIRG